MTSAFAWHTPPSLATWNDLDSFVADEYASFTNGAAIFPPFFSFGLYAGFYTFAPEDEIAAVTNLFAAGNILGVPVWKMRVTETQTTERVWLFYGDTASEPFRTNAVPAGFNPEQWVEEMYGTPPTWLLGERIYQWYRWRDRSRLHLTMTLIASNDWPRFLAAVRIAATNNPAPQTPPPTLPADTNRLSFAGVETCNAQMLRLWLYSPPDRAPVDLFGSDVLPPTSNRWSFVGSAPAGDPFSAWDEPMNGSLGFYCAARNDIDSDGDGIPDGRENLVFLTRSDKADTDGDGLSDLEETYRCETNPNAVDSDDDGVWDGEDQSPLTPGPLITILSPGDGAVLTSSIVLVCGMITFAGELDAVRVGGVRVTNFAQGNGTFAFTNQMTLDDGANEIVIRAMSADPIPLESKKAVTVTVDALPSEITVLSPADYESFDTANVRVTVWTESTNDLVTVNGNSTSRDGLIRYAWVQLSAVGTNTIVAVAVDGQNRSSTNIVEVICTDTTSTNPNDDDNDGVPNQVDLDPGDPSVSGTVVVTSPLNGARIITK